MLVFLPLLYFQHIYAFMELYLFGQKEFAYQSRVNAWMNVLEAILAVTLTYVFGLPGLVIGTAASYSIAVLAQLRHIGFAVGLRWRWPIFRELVVVGFPSHLNGLLYNIFLSIDRWLILTFLGLTSLGYYALGMTINQYLFQFSYAFGNVLSPHLVERYSERERVEDLRSMVEVPLTVISRVSPAALGLVYFGAEAVIRERCLNTSPGSRRCRSFSWARSSPPCPVASPRSSSRCGGRHRRSTCTSSPSSSTSPPSGPSSMRATGSRAPRSERRARSGFSGSR